MPEFKVLPYKSHDETFIEKLAIAVLDGNAVVNWSFDENKSEEIAFLPVKQLTPEELVSIRQRCGGLYFYAKSEWASPLIVGEIPIFHTVAPLSREEAEAFAVMYKDEKVRRLANGR